jgi:exopolysaccharide biosynthesis protein
LPLRGKIELSLEDYSMSRRRLVFFFVLTLSAGAFSRAEFPASQPCPGVTYSHETRSDPPQSIFIVTVDLNNPDVKIHVAPAGPDPDGAGEWQTTLMTVRDIASRERFDVAVNASYFAITIPKGAGEIAEEKAERAGAPVSTAPTTNAGYRAGAWAKSVGWAMSDGNLWSRELRPGWPVLWIDQQGHGHIGEPQRVPVEARQMVQGNVWIVKDAKPVTPTSNAKVRHPRTVIGLDARGTKLTILTIDGRRPGIAAGMTGPEIAQEMLRLGCVNAMNLDGGGSTTLVMRNPDNHELKVVNHPSDARERPVADVIGIAIKSAKRASD